MAKWIYPVNKKAKLSSPFGIRFHPVTGRLSFHRGIDLAIKAGSPIYAARSGKVELAKTQGGYGKTITIDHGGGVKTKYAHCSRLLVEKGQRVTAGAKIAEVGSTGVSTGAHLHFEIVVGGAPRNPALYINKKNAPAAESGDSAIAPMLTEEGYDGTQDGGVEVTEVSIASEIGSKGSNARQIISSGGKGVEIIIQGDKNYNIMLDGEVVLEWERGNAGVLKFNAVKDEILNIHEGNPVALRLNGKVVFAGYLFSKSRSDNLLISCTAYDQMRYLKNKDSISYAGKKYSDLLRMIAADYNLSLGEIEDTSYIIPSRIEEGTLLDILKNASDLTIINTGKMYELYDDCGKLTLHSLKNMLLPLLITESTACGYSYTSSIDEKTYNRIKLAYDDKDTGRRELYISNDPDAQNRWGILQLYEKVDTRDALKLKSDTLLKYYCKVQRRLSVNDCLGDIRVRSGMLVVVKMGLGDINVQNYMLVERVKHKLRQGEHLMDLELSGIRGEFNV